MPSDFPFYSVITTIQPPTSSVRRLSRKLSGCEGQLLIIGDKKGPATYPLAGAELVTIEAQRALPFQLAPLLPEGHYVRKNLGYLLAIQRKAACIYETDDDNAPLPHWQPRQLKVKAKQVTAAGWHNVYEHFSQRSDLIWPRGFPVEMLAKAPGKKRTLLGKLDQFSAPIQQGLANGSPDVDAIWRLVLDKPFDFQENCSLFLAAGTWCPFNSQSTWWWPEAYPLMYLPSFCTFRMTDIWRSYIAQRCLWAIGKGVAFHAAEAHQDRNQHNLLRDFADEVPGYLQANRIIECLAALKLRRGKNAMGENLLACYQALVNIGIFPEKELGLVTAWLADLAQG